MRESGSKQQTTVGHVHAVEAPRQPHYTLFDRCRPCRQSVRFRLMEIYRELIKAKPCQIV
ncbi:hypothetical protein D9M68_260860 [compost metagenome]